MTYFERSSKESPKKGEDQEDNCIFEGEKNCY